MSNALEARYGEATDDQLLEKFYTGDDYALELLVRRMQTGLWRQAFKQLPVRHVGRGHVADDVLQKTWIKVAATRDRQSVRWDGTKGSVRTWIGRILHNVVVSYLRSCDSRQTVTGDLGREKENGTVETAEARLVDHRLESESAARHTEYLRQRLVESVSRLPDKVRSILYMKMDGLSHQQIAGQLGLSKSTICYHVREATQLLRAEAQAA